MWILSLICVYLVATASAQRRGQRKEAKAVEPEYPRYPEITACPEYEGLQLYPHPDTCHQFYKCANGTLTIEACENGLLFDGRGAVHNYCNYHWAVNCEGRPFELIPLEDGGSCQYSFGIFGVGPCEDHYSRCEYGVPEFVPCISGLAYDERIHNCNWPDLLETCDAEAFLQFKCPEYIDPKDPAYKFLPHPRFASNDCGKFFICLEGQPRMIGCGDYSVFDDENLHCADPETVPRCANYFK